MTVAEQAAGGGQGAAIDPVTFEIIRHKLLRVTDETIIALENVSGSPITNEGHDMMASLYLPDGGLMVGGVGFLHHLTSAAQAVKHIIENFSDDPGIDEDDVYFFNDSYTAALHPPDVYMISPIHYEGELTGFVANFVHVTDIGAVDPGGFSPNAVDNFQEGFQTKGLKIVERGKLRKDVVETFLNLVRDPGMTQLDLKSQLAANHVAKMRMRRIYADYGVETVRAVADELINQSERLVRRRLGELPDGTWHVREYVDLPDDTTCRVELAVTKRDDTLTYDFTGTSPEAKFGINCCYWATWGAMFAPIFPLLAWDVTWNEGVTRALELVAPEGSVVNCRRPAPISIATVGTVQIVNNLSTLALSKMFGASERYRDRATAVWHGSHAHVETHGIAPDGSFFIAPLTDTFGGSGGARAFADGVDIGGEIPNVVSRWANAESQELNTPLVYLFRRVVVDSGGPGKFRGGVCHEYAFAPTGVGGAELGVVLFGKGTRAPMSLGMFGGYPGSNVRYSTFRDTNAADLPDSLQEIVAGERVDQFWGSVDLGVTDIQYVRFMGGGGYGDPLDREPDRVRDDVERGLVSAEAAHDVYGVVLAGAAVDAAATERRRLAMRAARIGQEVEPALGTRADVPFSGRPLGEYLQQTATGATQCTWCAAEVAPAGEMWKRRATIVRSPMARAGAFRSEDPDFALLECCCPTCGTLLDTEVVWRDDPPLDDSVTSWPGQES
ncbi:hydantoinase B/oxoprolinase family protein [Capillimicrobium parvum]|uniref:Acetophenone carboxylase delta subunit n=1 Tax=Capillimicrobium parvum TaxID=2884022 RepID=A0A9E7BYU8_9ACTN|nr:hydantoinase B/oxoprolinase family protein [Capillimicrobium parvum]UGS33884.1 Acetophenone carboxylase delta subunit [Capillimicrobium parvum]